MAFIRFGQKAVRPYTRVILKYSRNIVSRSGRLGFLVGKGIVRGSALVLLPKRAKYTISYGINNNPEIEYMYMYAWHERLHCEKNKNRYKAE
jgi:hypothetical protein